MKIELEKLEGNKAKVIVNFTAEEFDAAYEKELDKVVKDHEEKGFRKGAYPKSRYIAKYGDGSVYRNLIDELVEKTYYNALIESNCQPIDQPEIDIDYANMKKGNPFTYTMTVETFPEVVLGQYVGIEVVKEPTDVTDQEVEDYVNRELKNHSDLELVEDKELANGDTAVFDFCGSVDGVEFEGGKAENYELEIGSNQFIPGFEEQMVGMKVEEEKTITVHFPKEYHSEDLKDKDAQFKVKVHEIKVRVNPTLNDEFVKTLELENVNTVEEWKKHLYDCLVADKTEASKNKYENDIMETVCKNATFEVPEVMIKREIDYNLSSMEKQAKMYGLSLDDLMAYQGTSVEQYKEMYRPSAIAKISADLVLDKIIQVEKLEVEDQDYNSFYEEAAKRYNMEVEQIMEKLPKERVKEQVLIRKAYDFVIGKAIQK